MSKTAKEMWADAGFKFVYEYEKSTVFSDTDKVHGYITCSGSRNVEISKDGSFKGLYNNFQGDDEPIEFTRDMSMALIQQIAEFKE